MCGILLPPMVSPPAQIVARKQLRDAGLSTLATLCRSRRSGHPRVVARWTAFRSRPPRPLHRGCVQGLRRGVCRGGAAAVALPCLAAAHTRQFQLEWHTEACRARCSRRALTQAKPAFASSPCPFRPSKPARFWSGSTRPACRTGCSRSGTTDAPSCSRVCSATRLPAPSPKLVLARSGGVARAPARRTVGRFQTCSPIDSGSVTSTPPWSLWTHAAVDLCS